VPILLVLVLASGCKNSFSTRITSDYFPLEQGNKWIYNVTGENNYQIEIEVTGIENIEGDSIFLVSTGGEIKRFQRKPGTVNRMRELFTTYDGEKVSFGTIYEPYLLLPPIEGENWEKEFRFSSIHQGDTIEKVFSVKIDSVINTTLVLNSEDYKNVYLLKRIITEDNDSLIQYEWFAPNIGLVKKEIPSDSILWELTSFTLDEER
jgi:hypothetical protein